MSGALANYKKAAIAGAGLVVVGLAALVGWSLINWYQPDAADYAAVVYKQDSLVESYDRLVKSFNERVSAIKSAYDGETPVDKLDEQVTSANQQFIGEVGEYLAQVKALGSMAALRDSELRAIYQEYLQKTKAATSFMTDYVKALTVYERAEDGSCDGIYTSSFDIAKKRTDSTKAMLGMVDQIYRRQAEPCLGDIDKLSEVDYQPFARHAKYFKQFVVYRQEVLDKLSNGQLTAARASDKLSEAVKRIEKRWDSLFAKVDEDYQKYLSDTSYMEAFYNLAKQKVKTDE